MRTGIRCGLAPRQIVHLNGSTKASTLCGRKPGKWAPVPRTTLAEARALAHQDVEVCSACETRAFRLGWARLIAAHAEDELRRAQLREEAWSADKANRLCVQHVVASRICDRWRAAGFTTARLVGGLPQPERPHAATWRTDSIFTRCACGRVCYRSPLSVLCEGVSPFDMVLVALGRGVPFGLRDGLPTAGVPLEAEKLARATCRPIVTREEREAA